jgi:peroxiredoxin
MRIAVGQTAPDFTLKDQSQKEVKLSDFIRWIGALLAPTSMPALSAE